VYVRTATSLIVAVVAIAIAASSPATAACEESEHRQFDFWLGEWNVYGPKGGLAGVNRITSEYGGCVLHEHYTTDRGFAGESLDSYDSGRKVWHQTWVDNSGTVLLLDGGLRDGKMVLEGQTTDADGKVTQHRITWTPNADGTVRQFWESTDDQGQRSTVFDGTYKRK
jgi:hypothetical protein